MITEDRHARFPDPHEPQPAASQLSPAALAALKADGFTITDARVPQRQIPWIAILLRPFLKKRRYSDLLP